MSDRGQRLLASGATAAILLIAYATTLAPDVTFWDSGEFIAAAKTFGIPHPPGTPLYVAAANAFARLWFFLPYAMRVNLFSACCSAAAGGLSCMLMATIAEDWVVGVAAGVTAGAMSTVWQSSNETEVYAASLLLAVTAVVAAARRSSDSERGTLVSMYLMALAVPLHLSALVAAPAVVYFASSDSQNGVISWPRFALLSGNVLIVAGAGLVSWPIACVGLLGMLGGLALRRRATRDWSRLFPPAVIAVVVLGLSATLILLVRARFDPVLNQANPSTFAQLGNAIARRQYDVAPIWPRQASLWLQIANWFEYADWQFALVLAPTAVPSAARILVTVSFAALGMAGCLRHRALDRRTWTGLLLLFLGGSIGIIAYLNFKAGASFAWSILPDPARHEARDRDYFFILGFWVWGLWAGLGAAAIGRRWLGSAKVAFAVAAIPLMLNWDPSRRNEQPESSLPRELGVALLEPLPRNAVLFVAGDNDTYPLWSLQEVDGIRRDVTIVTIPLLGATWYRDELRRRWKLPSRLDSRGLSGLLADVGTQARAQHRQVAAAVTVEPSERLMIGRHWRFAGLANLEQDASSVTSGSPAELATDTVATRELAESIDRWRRGESAHPSADPVSQHFLTVLSCARRALSRARQTTADDSLDSLCNFR